MNLLTLNLWGGQVYEPLLEFLQKQAGDIDIFCFQEILFGDVSAFTLKHEARINLFNEVQECLPGYKGLRFPAPKEARYFQSEPLLDGVEAGQAIFVRDGLPVTDQGNFRTYTDFPEGMDYGGKITGSCMWAEVTSEKENVLVMNLHGLWQRDSNKKDTPARFEQSRILNDFISSHSGKKILCGDFNLRPDGKSMLALEENIRNLVKVHGIVSTRSELYEKEERFADYVLVSPEVEVVDFGVLPDVVSDHLPLRLEFS
jgi:exonuclease III